MHTLDVTQLYAGSSRAVSVPHAANSSPQRTWCTSTQDWATSLLFHTSLLNHRLHSVLLPQTHWTPGTSRETDEPEAASLSQLLW